MKSALRENRQSGGTKSKADRIVAELKNYPAHMQPRCPAGIFCAWKHAKLSSKRLRHAQREY